MSTFIIDPHDTVLNAKYEALNANQRRFADRLIEEKYFRIEEAIDMASKVQKWDYAGNPRTKKVEKIYSGYKFNLKTWENKPASEELTIAEFIAFKDFLSKYYDLDEEERMAVFMLIGIGKTLDEAIEYNEYYSFINKGCYSWVYSYEHDPVWNVNALDDVGDAMLENEIYDISECPEYLRRYIDGGLIAKDMILNDEIDYDENPDWIEDSYWPEHPYTYFYLKYFC